jgi:hypothetical protein
LEAVDASRGEIAVPKAMQAQLDATVQVGGIGSTTLTKEPDVDEVVLDDPPPEEIERIKAIVQELSVEEELVEVGDPNDAKQAALVAQSKKLVGAVRFIFEDCIQGILQILFLCEFWGELSWSTKIYVISSVVSGLSVSLGGPIHAYVKEYHNQQIYDQLPKLKEGDVFIGVVEYVPHIFGESHWWSGPEEQCPHKSYSRTEIIVESIRNRDDGSFDIKGAVKSGDVYMELILPPGVAPNEYETSLKQKLVMHGEWEGTYNPQFAALHFKDTVSILLPPTPIGFGNSYSEYMLKLEIGSNRAKGWITQDPARRSADGMKSLWVIRGEYRCYDEQVEQPVRKQPLTLRRGD